MRLSGAQAVTPRALGRIIFSPPRTKLQRVLARALFLPLSPCLSYSSKKWNQSRGANNPLFRDRYEIVNYRALGKYGGKQARIRRGSL